MSALRKLQVLMGERLVGTIAETLQREIFFGYSPEWLLSGFSISPYFLPFTPELKRETDLKFEGIFGVFDDSIPDGWGRLLMDRFSGPGERHPRRFRRSIVSPMLGTTEPGRSAIARLSLGSLHRAG